MSAKDDQIEGLRQLRTYLVKTRRTSVIAIGDKDDRIQSIIECQEGIRAIDEALKEEMSSSAEDFDSSYSWV